MKVFPAWKYRLLVFALVVGCLYALPNLYGEDPVLQISALEGQHFNDTVVQDLRNQLEEAHLKPLSIHQLASDRWIVHFQNTDQQLKAKTVLQSFFGDRASIGLNLQSRTPAWLAAIGAKPMKLGLDLRGGVHFLMEVDVQAALAREQNTGADLWAGAQNAQNMRREVMEQSLLILAKRVNELGVSEALVQRQGLNQIVIELPGIQDTAYARRILGKTATLKFLMEDQEHSLDDLLSGKKMVVGSKIYWDSHRRPVLLKTQPILRGESITSASSGQDREGRPAVNIRLGGDISLFSKTTREKVGQRLAVVYIEMNEGQRKESVISLATIQSPLGNQFQVTGLSFEGSRELALLLRSGALPAPVSVVEESIVGPSMGQENIRMGMISVAVGLALVVLFMSLYYSVFGILANVALLANLVLLVAALSIINATLTLPGIAGIVLTLGMAVDANVLIFERIREELRLGSSARASIQRGFDFAYATILDSNLTTLIVGIVLFSIGSGAIKGFAITLCIGILTSLFTAVMGSRALVELIHRGKRLKTLRVGV